MRLFHLHLVLALVPLLLVGVSHGAERPNILLIVSEDNGPELGCYGDPYVKTPVLDRLAREGVRFDNAFTPYSVCSPSRACFLTGRHSVVNGQLGLATHKFAMFEGWPSVFGLLKDAGYRTALIGKLHVNPEKVFTRHIDYRAIPGANFGRKSMGAYAAKAGEFFERGEEPFFLSINYPDAHFPLIPQVGGYPKDADLLTGKDVTPLRWVGCDSKRLRDATANYYNCLSRLDSLVADLLAKLEESGEVENTLILYIGDHGAQFSRGKTSVYDAGTRIPMIVHWPGRVQAGQVRDEIVSVTDILPTFLQAAGVEQPHGLSGRALQPLLEGEDAADWRKSLQFITTGAAPALGCLQFAFRTERYKLIVTPQGQGENLSAVAYLNQFNAHFIAGCKQEEISAAPAMVRKAYATYLNPPQYELYDLRKDPEEWMNLAGEPQYKATLDEMLAAYREWQKEVGDPFADPANIRFWLEEQEMGRKTNYRGKKEFRWGYLDRFGGK
jgi:N-sulfoglucosamine sulfohydrolase